MRFFVKKENEFVPTKEQEEFYIRTMPTPTVRYFVEKARNNTDLADLEQSAIKFAEQQEKPICPPDIYFWQKALMTPSVDSRKHQALLKAQEESALEFVKEGFLKDMKNGMQALNYSKRNFK